ncbi:MAG: hypothetical protein U0325_30245 [Polyangiales bacterium]
MLVDQATGFVAMCGAGRGRDLDERLIVGEDEIIAIAERLRQMLIPNKEEGPVTLYENAVAAATLATSFEGFEGEGPDGQLRQVDRLMAEYVARGEGILARHALLLFLARWKPAASYGLQLPRLAHRMVPKRREGT